MSREEYFGRLASHLYKNELDGHCPDDGMICEECCEHQDTDHNMCMDCNKQLDSPEYLELDR